MWSGFLRDLSAARRPITKQNLGRLPGMRPFLKMGEGALEGAVEGKVSDLTVSDHLTVR